MFGMGDSDESIDPLTSARGPYAFRHTPSFLLLILTRNLTGGYNFKGVTRWFAERADVILLFFDPDKPGIVVINPTTVMSTVNPIFRYYRRDSAGLDLFFEWS